MRSGAGARSALGRLRRFRRRGRRRRRGRASSNGGRQVRRPAGRGQVVGALGTLARAGQEQDRGTGQRQRFWPSGRSNRRTTIRHPGPDARGGDHAAVPERQVELRPSARASSKASTPAARRSSASSTNEKGPNVLTTSSSGRHRGHALLHRSCMAPEALSHRRAHGLEPPLHEPAHLLRHGGVARDLRRLLASTARATAGLAALQQVVDRPHREQRLPGWADPRGPRLADPRHGGEG